MYGKVKVWLHVYLIVAPDGGEWPILCPQHFTSNEYLLDTHWIGGWAVSRAALDMVVKRGISAWPEIRLRSSNI
jgi:hypothetical protein